MLLSCCKFSLFSGPWCVINSKSRDRMLRRSRVKAEMIDGTRGTQGDKRYFIKAETDRETTLEIRTLDSVSLESGESSGQHCACSE